MLISKQRPAALIICAILCINTLKEKFVFCTLSLIIRIFTIIHNFLQHYDDNWWSSKSWSSLLKTTGEHVHTDNLLKNTINKLAKCLSSHVATLTRKAKHRYITKKRLFQLLQETNSCFQVLHPCLASCFSVGTWKDITEHSMSLLKEHLLSFLTDCLSAHAPLLFSVCGDVSNELQLSGLHRSSSQCSRTLYRKYPYYKA